MSSEDESDGIYLILADDNEKGIDILDINNEDLNDYIVKLCKKDTKLEDMKSIKDEDENDSSDELLIDRNELKSEPDNPKILCKYCNRVLNGKSEMLEHYENVHKFKLLCCRVCQKIFMDMDILAKHEAICLVEGPKKPLVKKGLKYTKMRCMKCDKWIIRKQFKQHLRTHDPPAYSCDQCTARFKDKAALESHNNAHAGIRPYACNYCTNTYTSRTALYRHKRHHTGITYTCEFCGKEFKLSDAYSSHLKKHTEPQEDYLCVDCGKKFKEKKSFLLHRKIHETGKPHRCHYCDKSFLRLFHLKLHMKNKHNSMLITKKYYYNMMARNASSSGLLVNKFDMLNELPPGTGAIDIKEESEELSTN